MHRLNGSLQSHLTSNPERSNVMDISNESDIRRPDPPYLDVCIAGGIGGSMADFLMHSIDTVKTRLQGQPTTIVGSSPKYLNMFQAYRTILLEEGISRGLYSGITPAISGAIPSTTAYFGIYELTKRTLISHDVPDVGAHLIGGALGDLTASVVYVPSEVLKTRMQLQGRYNNPHFISGYNYRNTLHAARMIVQYDGWGALYHGYRATLLRDVPFSALQFAFYEKLKAISLERYIQPGEPLTFGVEVFCGSLAGGIAGALTTPLDVVKTLLQTQQRRAQKPAKITSSPPPSPLSLPSSSLSSPPLGKTAAITTTTTTTTTTTIITTPPTQPQHAHPKYYQGIVDGLIFNYRTQGFGGLFRGIGPRVFWTSLQSAAMFVIYEQMLQLQDNMRYLGEWPYGKGWAFVSQEEREER